jgi:uncharacterized protein YggE
MMRGYGALLAALLTVAWAGDAVAAPGDSKRSEMRAKREVQVAGMATFNVEPDEVVVSVTICTEDEKSIIAAKQDNDKRTLAVLALREKYKLDKSQVEIRQFSMEPVWNPSYQGRAVDRSLRNVVAYRVTRDLTFTLKDFRTIELLIGDAVQAGATSIDSVVFRTTKHDVHQVEARRRAVDYARKKAAHLAELNGLKLGKATEITENVEWNNRMGEGSGMGGMMGDSVRVTRPQSHPSGEAQILLVSDSKPAASTTNSSLGESASADQGGANKNGAGKDVAKTAAPTLPESTAAELIQPESIAIQAVVNITFEMLE